ncbi:hypothetical protein [Streptomyces sp. NPDC002671]
MRRGAGGGLRRLWPWRGRGRDESALAEIEAQITAFGEALDVHSFSPGQPGATDEMRAELERALDAYEQAKRDFANDRTRADADAVRLTDGPGPITPQPGPGRSVPAQPRAAKPRTTTPLRAAQPQVSGTGGSGEQTHRLAMPPYRPAVMVFSTDGQERVHLRFEGRKGRSSRLYRLSGDGTPFTARIPLPEGSKAIVFRVFAAGDREAWTATAAPLREVPRFHEEINGTGSDVVHYRGEPGPGVLHYAGPSLVQLEALDDRLAYWVTVAEGRAGEHRFQWPGRGYYQVRSAGAWSLSTT